MISIDMIKIYSSETDLQKNVVKWLRLVLPEPYLFHHSPGEGKNKVQWYQKLKTMGFCTGWPDLEIFVMGHKPIFIELKQPNNSLSIYQKEVKEKLENFGYFFVCKSLSDCHASLSRVIPLSPNKFAASMIKAEDIILQQMIKDRAKEKERKKKLQNLIPLEPWEYRKYRWNLASLF